MKALFRGLFRCRVCGHVHGAYGVQDPIQQPQVVYYGIEENNLKPRHVDTSTPAVWSKLRLEPDRCPVCPAHPVCLFVGGTRIAPYEPTPDVVKPNRKRRGGLLTARTRAQQQQQKAG